MKTKQKKCEGGPGCSSQLALLTENGPCRVTENGHDTTLNPYSWNNKSNIIFVDQPPGTGFSTGNNVTTETEIAQDIWAFLQNFITQFPQYFTNGFYVIGESYGGHFVPNIVNYLWKQNNGDSGTYINLKGFGIGNGMTEPYIQYAWYGIMAYNSSTALNSEYDGIPINETVFHTMKSKIPECQSLIKQCNEYGTVNNSICEVAYITCVHTQLYPVEATGVNQYNMNEECQVDGLCYNFSAENVWLNNKTVQSEIGVDMEWNACDDQVVLDLLSDEMKGYADLIIEPIESGIRGLIYAGDLDFICNWLGNEAWTLALEWNGQSQFNATSPVEWKMNGEAVGTIRQAEGLTNFTFFRVYQAGHLV